MKLELNGNDILNKKFEKDVKGYNADEVDEFLDEIIKDYKNIDSTIRTYKTEIVNLKRENDSLQAAIREKDSELSREKNKYIVTRTVTTDNSLLDPIELLQKCSRYEKKLFDLGIDPSKIK